MIFALAETIASFRFFRSLLVPPWYTPPHLLLDMENMDLQPEDVRVPSGDSSPTQVPPDDNLSHQDHTADSTPPADPALLPSRTNTMRTIRITLIKFTIPPTELGPSLNHLRNGLVADATRHAIGSIVLGSTIRPFVGSR